LNHLQLYARQRRAPADQQLLRYQTGRAITHRRYDHLWTRIGTHLPWVATQQISTHWLRHTTLTWVERNFGYATARATATYVRATIHDIATALATLTGEPHPPRNLTSTPTTYRPGAGPAGRAHRKARASPRS